MGFYHKLEYFCKKSRVFIFMLMLLLRLLDAVKVDVAFVE